MARNIEWKARARDLQRQRRLAEELAGARPELLRQVDTFFPVAHGRLKLRRLADDHGELIHYSRPDCPGPKLSDYSIVATPQPDSLRALLVGALGVLGEVRKQRWLYLAGQVRIHFDEVDNLGHFLELEVVLRPDQALADGEQIAETFRRRLEVRDEDLIDVAYLDLLLRSALTASVNCRAAIGLGPR